jgi:hypothetical protein
VKPGDGKTLNYDKTKKGSSLEVTKAIDVILKAIDCRMRKLFFPTSAWFANYIRPIFPD